MKWSNLFSRFAHTINPFSRKKTVHKTTEDKMLEQYSVYIAAFLFIAAISFTWKVNQRIDIVADDLSTTREELARLNGLIEGLTIGDELN